MSRKDFLQVGTAVAASMWFFIWVFEGITGPSQQISPPHCYEANKALQQIIRDQGVLQDAIERIKNKKGGA